MDFPKFVGDFFIPDCIEELAENGVRASMHVGAAAAAVPLERLKPLNRLLLSYH